MNAKDKKEIAKIVQQQVNQFEERKSRGSIYQTEYLTLIKNYRTLLHKLDNGDPRQGQFRHIALDEAQTSILPKNKIKIIKLCLEDSTIEFNKSLLKAIDKIKSWL